MATSLTSCNDARTVGAEPASLRQTFFLEASYFSKSVAKLVAASNCQQPQQLRFSTRAQIVKPGSGACDLPWTVILVRLFASGSSVLRRNQHFSHGRTKTDTVSLDCLNPIGVAWGQMWSKHARILLCPSVGAEVGQAGRERTDRGCLTSLDPIKGTSAKVAAKM